MPLRAPAVLAVAASSLDLLSRGRFEVALSAGYRWDEIEIMVERRLTSGEVVDALSEAIGVIRGAWDLNEGALDDRLRTRSTVWNLHLAGCAARHARR
ncbi:MAG TPA: LLM class flavin-dependent oxidoreductase [Chloroflexota bacterium]